MRQALSLYLLLILLISFWTAGLAQAPQSANAAAPAASNPEGKALLAKVFAAAGGTEKLSTVKSVRVKVNITLKDEGVSLEAEETDVLPDRVHDHMKTPGGELVAVVSPQDSFVSAAGMGAVPMPSSQREDSLQGMHRAVWYVAQHAKDPEYVFSVQGKEKIGDLQASILDIHGDGQQWRWYVDQNGRVLRGQYQRIGPNGPSTRIVDYSEFKPVDGITVPFHEEITVDGKPAATVVVNSYEFNPNIDLKIYEKPPVAEK